MTTVYLNIKTQYGTETVDTVTRADFPSAATFRDEVERLVGEYHIAGMAVYSSQRASKKWRDSVLQHVD